MYVCVCELKLSQSACTGVVYMICVLFGSYKSLAGSSAQFCARTPWVPFWYVGLYRNILKIWSKVCRSDIICVFGRFMHVVSLLSVSMGVSGVFEHNLVSGH